MIRPFWHGKDEKTQIAMIRESFQEVFSTPKGQQVLAVILEDLYYWKRTGTPEEEAMANYAKYLVSERIGCHDRLADVAHLVKSAKET